VSRDPLIEAAFDPTLVVRRATTYAENLELPLALWSMIRKKPALGLDPGVEAGFPKRSCSAKV